MVVAYHDANGWSWAESFYTYGAAYSNFVDSKIDISNDLSILLRTDYEEYSLIGFNSQGGKWSRVFDGTQLNDAYPLMDIEGNTIHLFSWIQDSARYDSQSISCQNYHSDGCYIWISINANGAKTSQLSVAHPSVSFYNFEVHQSKAYLYGYSSSGTNFTGTFVPNDNQTQEAAVLCSLESTGNWDYHHIFFIEDDDYILLSSPIYEDDGSAFFFTFVSQQSGNDFFDELIIRI